MKPDFNKLWNGYPAIDYPCDGRWLNQCAIRLSFALNADGSIKVNKKTYNEPKCSHGHARGAESLANWLWKYHLGRPKIFKSGETAKTTILGATGIIFFKDCFTRAGQRVQRGDHIDLWRQSETVTYNDPDNQAKQVWFWQLA